MARAPRAERREPLLRPVRARRRAAAVSDRALVDAMVEFEVALLRALADAGARSR